MTRRRSRSGLAVLAAVLTLLAACTEAGGTPATTPSSGPAAGSSADPPAPATADPGRLRPPDHVVVAVFENKTPDQILNSGHAPWFASIASSGAVFTNAHAVTHPSQPNYVALFSGSTQGITSDRCPVQLTGDNLASQLAAAGQSFAGYAEGLPTAGFTGCVSGRYQRKHNPWVDFGDLPTAVNQPLRAMPTDFAQLPTVAFVVPDACHDMHDCPVATGDAWARDHLGPYARWAQDHESLLILTFDEDGGSSDNHIPTLVTGAQVHPGSRDQRVDHYSVLRTLEDLYGLPPLGNAAGASPLQGVWVPTGG